MLKALVCSTRIVEKMMGPPMRGLVHSAFAGAANLIFPDGFLLSLNAVPRSTSHEIEKEKHELSPGVLNQRTPGVLLMPNGLLLSAHEGEFPFADLRAGMPVVLGAGWLAVEALAYSLDCTACARWNPRISRPEKVDSELVKSNASRLARLCERRSSDGQFAFAGDETILAVAERVCGRGAGLTPSGDDFLAGWVAVGWLLYGPQPEFLACCQGISEIARRRTHALSQCWLAYAAAGDVALPIGSLLAALTADNVARLEDAASAVLALGASSGFDLLQGMLCGIERYPGY